MNMYSGNLSNATFHNHSSFNSIQTRNVDSMLFNVGPASLTMTQHQVNRESMCLLGPLNVFPFDKQVYINLKDQYKISVRTSDV